MRTTESPCAPLMSERAPSTSSSSSPCSSTSGVAPTRRTRSPTDSLSLSSNTSVPAGGSASVGAIRVITKPASSTPSMIPNRDWESRSRVICRGAPGGAPPLAPLGAMHSAWRMRGMSAAARRRRAAACSRTAAPCAASPAAGASTKSARRARLPAPPRPTPRAAGVGGAAGGVTSSEFCASVASAFRRSAAGSSAAVSRGGVVWLELACDGSPRPRGELSNREEPSRLSLPSCGSLSCNGSGLVTAPSERAFLALGGGPAGRSRARRTSAGAVCASRRRCSVGVAAATVVALRPLSARRRWSGTTAPGSRPLECSLRKGEKLPLTD
mmetsp:Transcript_30012/g.76414  ORF Transcript_30012/g.76414 Transcript_30012/m.76414 type:complete len:327 (+) Transcript_30012:655-1635(+)